ncbi:hypothetical protein K439DRAFT_1614510 [Ramaria rubella]|nr:hypothetical protein K439DRAFT_1614510 [Ramaria rubella]
MFRLSSLPSVPGISSDPPKLAFRNASNGLVRLARNNIPRDETTYWKQYWELFDSVEDVNTLITPQHTLTHLGWTIVRTALQQQPDNIRTLLTVLATYFIRLIRSPTFPRPSTTTFALPLSPWSGSSTADDVKSVLNCARVIARVLPIIWEDESDWTHWLWEEGEEEAIESSTADSNTQTHFVIEDEDEDEPEAGSSKAAEEPAKKSIPSLMAQFLSALVDSLFHAGFTLPAEVVEGTSKTAYLIWASGVGSSNAPSATSPIPAYRSTLLLTLLTAMSQPLYATPISLRQQSTPVLAYLSSLPRKTYLALLCSLLNTSLTPPPARYIGQVTRDEDLYPQRTAQALLVLLCQEGERPNVYQKATAKLHREQDFQFLIESVKAALDSEAAKGGLVNGVTKAVPVGRRGNGPGALEIWLLLWRMIDLNRKFTNYLLASPHLPAIISHLFSTMAMHKDSPPQFALLRTLCYLLQTISSNRTFAVMLSSTLPHSTAPRASDALVNAAYTLIAGTNGQHAGLYQPLLITLGNVAPYIKGLNVQSSSRLTALFQAFASPQFLLADEGNPRCAFWMLEFFTHIIHHQFSDNPNLIYAILRTHERLQVLATFTLSSALAEIARAKAAKEEHLRRTGAVTPDQKRSQTPDQSASQSPEDEGNDLTAREEKDRVRDREETLAATTVGPEQPVASQSPPPGALSEKARGKLRARSPSVGSLTSPGLVGNASSILGYESASGFVATEEWVQSWVQGLPLDSILIAMSELLPKIQNMKTPSNAANFLASATLVGILPPAPPIISRRFQWTDRSEVWRASLLWGEIYVSSGPAQGPWAGTQIRLFGIKVGKTSNSRPLYCSRLPEFSKHHLQGGIKQLLI